MSHLLYPLPDGPIDVVRAALADHLSADESYRPAVPWTPQQTLDAKHSSQERRRYLSTPEPVTGFGSL